LIRHADGRVEDEPHPWADQPAALFTSPTSTVKLDFDRLTHGSELLSVFAKSAAQATANKEQRRVVVESLEHWQRDTDLVGIRYDAGLAKLPETERVAFRKLWAGVDALLKKAAGP
jgi:hypothetical protein